MRRSFCEFFAGFLNLIESVSEGFTSYFRLVVAGGVFYGVFLCCPFSPLDVLDEIWDILESVSEGFLTYSSK